MFFGFCRRKPRREQEIKELLSNTAKDFPAGGRGLPGVMPGGLRGIPKQR